ncbi:hypothetical protein M0813_24356 [Anaeramoeba flamelloides]|uniref:Uncharacterized protein n=1 Tax=Anaeramoeba flamelloides TaxID=1746091 RepID=A0ABQ8Y6A3_9EUKA|nr:hypothetical protein M0813_24356 [Anaeramoeba flamelloides]
MSTKINSGGERPKQKDGLLPTQTALLTKKSYVDRFRYLKKIKPQYFVGLEQQHLDKGWLFEHKKTMIKDGPKQVKLMKSCITELALLTNKTKRTIERGINTFFKNNYHLTNCSFYSRDWLVYKVPDQKENIKISERSKKRKRGREKSKNKKKILKLNIDKKLSKNAPDKNNTLSSSSLSTNQTTSQQTISNLKQNGVYENRSTNLCHQSKLIKQRRTMRNNTAYGLDTMKSDLKTSCGVNTIPQKKTQLKEIAKTQNTTTKITNKKFSIIHPRESMGSNQIIHEPLQNQLQLENSSQQPNFSRSLFHHNYPKITFFPKLMKPIYKTSRVSKPAALTLQDDNFSSNVLSENIETPFDSFFNFPFPLPSLWGKSNGIEMDSFTKNLIRDENWFEDIEREFGLKC